MGESLEGAQYHPNRHQFLGPIRGLPSRELKIQF